METDYYRNVFQFCQLIVGLMAYTLSWRITEWYFKNLLS